MIKNSEQSASSPRSSERTGKSDVLTAIAAHILAGQPELQLLSNSGFVSPALNDALILIDKRSKTISTATGSTKKKRKSTYAHKPSGEQ